MSASFQPPSSESLQRCESVPDTPLELTLLPNDIVLDEGNYDVSEHDIYMLTHTTIESTFPEHNPYARGRIQTLELPDGRIHRQLYSAPENPDAPPSFRIINILGWTESIDTKVIQKTHTLLSKLHPDVPVSTEATYGLDGTADDLGIRERLHLDLDTTARRMYETFKMIYKDGLPIVMVPTSQGASLLARIRQYNEEDGKPLNISEQILNEPYLRTKEQKHIGAARFFMHMFVDVPKELFTRTAPRELPEILWDYLTSAPHKRDAAAIIGQGLSLLECTEESVIYGMLAHGALILQGEKDCLRCDTTNTAPGAKLKVIPGKGHSMGLNYRKRATGISKGLTTSLAARAAIASL